MKFIVDFIASVFYALILFSCAEHAPSEHEQLYLDTVDSLKLYGDLPAVKSQINGSDLVGDYLSLTFDEYLEKHDIDEHELDLLSKSLQVTIRITKAFQVVEENMDEIQPLERADTGSNQNGGNFTHLINQLMDEIENDSLLAPEVNANFNVKIMLDK